MPRPLPNYQHKKVTVESVERAKVAWLDAPPPKKARTITEALGPSIVPQSVPPTPLELYRATILLGTFAEDYLAHVVKSYGRWNAAGTNDPPGWPPHITKFNGRYYLAGPAIQAAAEEFWSREATEDQRAWYESRWVRCAGGCGRIGGLFMIEGDPTDERYCHNCIVGRGLTPRKVAKPEPMSEEEIASRRAARLNEERSRRWRGDELAWDRGQPIFLTVPHRQDDGLLVAKMVGKIDLVNVEMIKALYQDIDRERRKEDPTGAWRDLDTDDAPLEPVFYHAHTPSQRHHKLDCPAPLDTVVADFLRRSGVNWVFCYERHESQDGGRAPGMLRFSPIHRFRMAPEVEYDRRWRYYLAEDHWEHIREVREYRKSGGSRLAWGDDRELILESPWIPEHQRLVLKKGKPE